MPPLNFHRATMQRISSLDSRLSGFAMARTVAAAVYSAIALAVAILPGQSIADDNAPKADLRIAQPAASGFQDVDQHVGQLLVGYTGAVSAVDTQHAADLAELQKGYLKALDRLSKYYQDAGSASGALAVRNEQRRIQAGTVAPELADSEELENFLSQQSNYQTALHAINATKKTGLIDANGKVSKALEEYQRSLTRAGALDRVAAVGNILKLIPSPPTETPAFDPNKRPETPEELAQFLTGTKWSWEGGKPSSAVFLPNQQYEVSNNASGRIYGRYTYTINDKLEVSTPYGGPGHSMKIVFNGNFRSFELYNEPEHKQSRQGKFLSRDSEKSD